MIFYVVVVARNNGEIWIKFSVKVKQIDFTFSTNSTVKTKDNDILSKNKRYIESKSQMKTAIDKSLCRITKWKYTI